MVYPCHGFQENEEKRAKMETKIDESPTGYPPTFLDDGFPALCDRADERQRVPRCAHHLCISHHACNPLEQDRAEVRTTTLRKLFSRIRQSHEENLSGIQELYIYIYNDERCSSSSVECRDELLSYQQSGKKRHDIFLAGG